MAVPNPIHVLDHGLLRWGFGPAAQWADYRLGVNHYRIARGWLMVTTASLYVNDGMMLLDDHRLSAGNIASMTLNLLATVMITLGHWANCKELARLSKAHEAARTGAHTSALQQCVFSATPGWRLVYLVLGIGVFLPGDLVMAARLGTHYGPVVGALTLFGRLWFTNIGMARYWAAVWVPPGQRKSYAESIRQSVQALAESLSPAGLRT